MTQKTRRVIVALVLAGTFLAGALVTCCACSGGVALLVAIGG